MGGAAPSLRHIYFVRDNESDAAARSTCDDDDLDTQLSHSLRTRLTVIVALCIIVHQLCAVALHVSKGDYSVLGLNIVLIVLAALIFWWRETKAIVLPRS